MSDLLPQQPATPDPLLVSIGDIGFSRYWVVTPNGSARINGTNILVTDLTRVESKIPTWAIVLAVIGAFFFLLGLLFLLARETRVTGSLSVTVQNDGFFYATQIPVTHAGVPADVHNRVMQARQLIALAPAV